MIIRLYHENAYDWEVVNINTYTPQQGDVISTNAQGNVTRRITIPSNFTDVVFSTNSITDIQNSKKKAGIDVSEYQIIARHIEDAILPIHCPEIMDITCENKDVEVFLKTYFGIKKKPRKGGKKK